MGHGTVPDAFSSWAFLGNAFHDVHWWDGWCWLQPQMLTAWSRADDKLTAVDRRWHRRRQGKVVRHARCSQMPSILSAPTRCCQLSDSYQTTTVNVGGILGSCRCEDCRMHVSRRDCTRSDTHIVRVYTAMRQQTGLAQQSLTIIDLHLSQQTGVGRQTLASYECHQAPLHCWRTERPKADCWHSTLKCCRSVESRGLGTG